MYRSKHATETTPCLRFCFVLIFSPKTLKTHRQTKAARKQKHKRKWGECWSGTAPFHSFCRATEAATTRKLLTYSPTQLPISTRTFWKTRRSRENTSSWLTFLGNQRGRTMKSLLILLCFPLRLQLHLPERRRFRRWVLLGGIWRWWSHGLFLPRVPPALLFILLLICHRR